MAERTASGWFIVFEGIEGAGKSTQIELLAGRLRARGLDPVLTREPGGTPLGEKLREYLLAKHKARPDPRVEAFLMVADRADHVIRVLRPSLEQGRMVLCDRYEDATHAYQGGGSGVENQHLVALNRLATGGLRPDVVVFLDLPAADAAQRLRCRGTVDADRFESEPETFFARVRKSYLELASREPGRWLILDARRAKEELADDIENRVMELLKAGPTVSGVSPRTFRTG